MMNCMYNRLHQKKKKTSGPGINLFYLQTRSFHVLPVQSHAHIYKNALLFFHIFSLTN